MRKTKVSRKKSSSRISPRQRTRSLLDPAIAARFAPPYGESDAEFNKRMLERSKAMITKAYMNCKHGDHKALNEFDAEMEMDQNIQALIHHRDSDVFRLEREKDELIQQLNDVLSKPRPVSHIVTEEIECPHCHRSLTLFRT